MRETGVINEECNGGEASGEGHNFEAEICLNHGPVCTRRHQPLDISEERSDASDERAGECGEPEELQRPETLLPHRKDKKDMQDEEDALANECKTNIVRGEGHTAVTFGRRHQERQSVVQTWCMGP